MSKTVKLELTESEYKELLQGYLLGYLIEDELEAKSEQQILAALELLNKYCKAGFEGNVKGFIELQSGIYGYPPLS